MKPHWSARTLPRVYPRASGPSKRREIGYLGVAEYPGTAKNLSTGRVERFLNSATFSNTKHIGEFETIFRQLPQSVLKGLNTGNDWIPHAGALLRYHRDRAEAVLSIRKGNEWGSLVNAPELLAEASTGPEALDILTLAGRALKPVGLRPQDLRSPGYCASLILRQVLPGRRPPRIHAQRFLDSFRGARFEATTFGTIPNCHDYDISSAYPHYLSQLITTSAVTWRDSTDLSLADSATYAAVLADVTVPETLDRGPMAYRLGETSLFFPVGKLHKAWLNLPEVQLMRDCPEVGTITKVYAGSWGIPFAEEYPFAPVVKRLFKLRRSCPEIAPYIKRIMVSVWGKTQSRYKVGREWVSPVFWNPVYSSHVTASMRADNYRRTLGQHVYGEFVDGFAVDHEMKTHQGMGGLRHEGSGSMLVITDLFKQSAWKRLFENFRVIMESDLDARAVVVRKPYARTLAEVVEAGEPGGEIGRESEAVWPVPLGSSIRRMNGGGFDCRDFLTGTIETTPPREDQLEAMAWARRMKAQTIFIPDEIF